VKSEQRNVKQFVVDQGLQTTTLGPNLLRKDTLPIIKTQYFVKQLLYSVEYDKAQNNHIG